jgi:hypothetical protein
VILLAVAQLFASGTPLQDKWTHCDEMLIRFASWIDASDFVVRFQAALDHVVSGTAAGTAMRSNLLALEFSKYFEFQVESFQLSSIEVFEVLAESSSEAHWVNGEVVQPLIHEIGDALGGGLT